MTRRAARVFDKSARRDGVHTLISSSVRFEPPLRKSALRRASPALVLAAIAAGACQDKTTLEFFPTTGGTSGTSGEGATAGGGGGGTGAGATAGSGTVAGATGGGSGGAGATSGSAGTQAASGTGGTEMPVGGEAGQAGAATEVTEGGAGGVQTTGGAGGAPVEPSTLVHRYDFSGTGTLIPDLVGGADATFENGVLTGDGLATLNGMNQYVELPPGIISVLRNATFVIWLNWAGNRDWERVFDFGNNDGTSTAEPGVVGEGITTFWLTPRNIPIDSRMPDEAALGFQAAPSRLFGYNFSTVLPADRFIQIAVALDLDLGSTSIYLDGGLVFHRMMDASRPIDLSLLTDDNNWLGRSQWTQDQVSDFTGSYDEFRIYASALDDAAMAELFALGPDVLP
jgi:hypothetical protein